MKSMSKSTVTLVLSLCVIITSDNAIGEVVRKNGKDWHVIPGTATSTPSYIEKSRAPNFEEKNVRKKRNQGSLERLIAPKATSTSTPPVKEINETHLPRPRKFEVSIIDNTCRANEFSQNATFVACNDDVRDIKVLELFRNPFARLVSPRLPKTIKADACRKFRVVGKAKRPFDCSGIYSLSFKAKIKKSKQEGFFSAAIVK